LQQQQKLQQQALALLPKLPRQGNFAEVSKIHPDAAIALGLLHRAGHLTWKTPFIYEIHSFHNQQQKLQQQMGDQSKVSQMQAYSRVKGDRWAFLLDNFGFEEESKLLLRSKS